MTASFRAARWLSLRAASLASTAFSDPLFASSVSEMSWSVTSPIVEQTTTSWFPRENRAARDATCLIALPVGHGGPAELHDYLHGVPPKPIEPRISIRSLEERGGGLGSARALADDDLRTRVAAVELDGVERAADAERVIPVDHGRATDRERSAVAISLTALPFAAARASLSGRDVSYALDGDVSSPSPG